MAKRVIINKDFWRCGRYPWGCSKEHETRQEAEACENYDRKSHTTRHVPGKDSPTAYWGVSNDFHA